jgi:hypothetical protein
MYQVICITGFEGDDVQLASTISPTMYNPCRPLMRGLPAGGVAEITHFVVQW